MLQLGGAQLASSLKNIPLLHLATPPLVVGGLSYALADIDLRGLRGVLGYSIANCLCLFIH